MGTRLAKHTLLFVRMTTKVVRENHLRSCLCRRKQKTTYFSDMGHT